MLRIIRWAIPVVGMAMIIVLTTSGSGAQNADCAPSHPPDPCNILPMLYSHSKIHAWPQCNRLRVDIFETTMRTSCPGCPGGLCVNCILHGYRENGFPAWNTPFHSLFNSDIFKEVEGKPFDVRVRMASKDQWQSDPLFEGHRTSSAITDNSRKDAQVPGCGTIASVSKTITWLNGGWPWHLDSNLSGSARQVAVHELGHALALDDVSGESIQTIMDNKDFLTWTANPADGQGLACLYGPIRAHMCQ